MGGAVGALSRDERIGLLVSLAGMVHTRAFAQREFGEEVPDQGYMWEEPDCPLSQVYMDDMTQIDTVVERGAEISVPWLLVHGTEDDVVPIEDSRDILAKAGDATDLWRQITVTLTVVCLLLATLAAVFSRGQTRLFAGGFALTGWLYMTLAFVSAFGLRDDLLTDKAIQWLGEVIHGDDAVAEGSPYDEVDIRNMYYLLASQGNGTFAQQTTPLPNLTAIGHAQWAIIIGWLGGVVALWLRRKDPREQQIPD